VAVRRLLLLSSSGLLLLAIMFLGSLVLWVGVPLAWLWVGSQVEGATQSLGAALAVAILGVAVSIVVLVPLLGWLNKLHEELRVARGFESHGQTALEAVMAVSAAVAVVGFVVWFFVFSGSSPVPLNLSY
jgi:heme/copper-type cytochrome/quinol oxidase subunit 2